MQADLLVVHGTVVTMNPDREVIDDGAVAVVGDEIRAVGPTAEIQPEYDAERVIDASDHAVLPGFISTHSHVSDILLRGIGNDRSLYDWLLNVKIPGTTAMTAEEHGIASALYATEAIRSGLTTVVEFGVGARGGYDEAVLAEKFDVYEAAGFRNAFAHAFADGEADPEFREFVRNVKRKAPAVEHPPVEPQDTDGALDEVEGVIETYHGTADGRQTVWPGPLQTYGVTPDGLRRAVDLAESYDVMATTHNSEVPLQERRPYSSVEYLRNEGVLGDRLLLAHCVCLDDRDVRMLAGSGARVAHNLMTNLALGDGFAPVPAMIEAGITVGLGLDNTSASDTAAMVPHLRATALAHKGHARDAGVLTAETVLEMATIDAARAIGRRADLGSLEAGKLADLLLVDLSHDHLTPHRSVASALVYQAQGWEVDTVVCDGEVIANDGTVPGIDREFPDLGDRVQPASDAVVERAGLSEVAGNERVSDVPE
jgi:5-methylthioadenosine/S-adenosylhomocysteine deaminase